MKRKGKKKGKKKEKRNEICDRVSLYIYIKYTYICITVLQIRCKIIFSSEKFQLKSYYSMADGHTCGSLEENGMD